MGEEYSGGSVYDKSITLMLLASLALYILDFMVTKFNGFDFVSFMNLITIEKIIRIVTGAIFILTMALYALSQKKWDSDTAKNVLTFGILTIFISIIISSGGLTLGNLLHLGIALWVYYGILRPQNQELVWVANFQIIVLMLVDYFLLAILYDYGIKLKLLPIWFFGIYIFSRDMKQSKYDQFLMLVVTVFLMFAFTSSYLGFTNVSDTMDPSVMSDFQQMVQQFQNGFLNFFFGLGTATMQIFNQTSAVYQESYYTGEIDSNAEKELGVFIRNLEIAQPEYYYDEPVSIWATLVVKTLNDPITVETECVSEEEREEEYHADKLHPEKFTAVQFDERPVDCVFNKYSFRPGSYYMTIKTTFDFQTHAYQKKYFINKERANSLIRQGAEPLTHYGISDVSPRAVYTAGPLMIGMDTENSLIKVDTTDSEEQIIYVGITLSNIWDGKINELNRLILSMPQYMSLENNECSGREFEQLADNSDGISYKLKEPIKDITDFKTIRCPIRITSKTGILGQAPLAIRYLKVETNYSYTIKQEKSISVRPNEDYSKLITKTKASKPKFAIPKIEMDKEDNISIPLFEYAYDAETRPKELLYFNLDDSYNESIISCKKYERFFLKCMSFNNSGSTTVSISVNDIVSSTRAKFEICVADGCKLVQDITNTTNTSANSINQSNTTIEGIGPILKQEIPEHSFISGEYDPYQIFANNYFQDGDAKTHPVDMYYIFPTDSYIKAYTTKAGTSIWILFESNTHECINNHPYTFTVRDGDGNEQPTTIIFNIEGCSS
jgi:hypothetical protein